MAARLPGPVASLVTSTPLPSSGGAAATPASNGVQAAFAQMIDTLAEAGLQPKTTARPLPKIITPPAAQQAPAAGQPLPKASHPSNTAAAPPAQRPAKAAQSAGRGAARPGQEPDTAPQSPNPNPAAGDAAAAIVPPPIPASTPTSTQPSATGRVDNDPREPAVGSTAAPPSGGAEPPAAAANPPSAAAVATALESRSAAPFPLPNDTPPAPAPEGLLSSPATAATAAAISATAATPLATALAAPTAARTTTPAPAPTSALAAQIAPTLISVAQSASGTQRLTIRLDPPELGTVQIRVEHPADAPMQVEINVQRPETLTLLMRDQPHLQHALDQAGVPAEGRTLTFQLDPQDQRGTAGDPGSGHGRRAPTPQPAAQQMQVDPDDPGDPTAGMPRWSRVALDITA